MPEADTRSLLNDPRADFGANSIDVAVPDEDFRDSPTFETLEADFRKTETDGPSAIDWKSFNALSLQVIQSQSKDLVLATRLTYGLYNNENYLGLAVGLSILRGMVSEHWDTMFPPVKRERGRVGAFDWLAEKLAPSIEAKPPGEEALVHALVAHDLLVELDELLEQKLSKYSVALGPLTRALRPHAKQARLLQDAAAEAEKQETTFENAEVSPATDASSPPAQSQPEPAPSVGTTVEKTPSPPIPTPPTTAPAPPPEAAAVQIPALPEEGDVEASAKAIFNAASKVATSIRQQAPADPRGYLCARFASWGRIHSPPPDTTGKTSLPAPQKTKTAEIEALIQAGNNEALVRAAESAFVATPFWLDTQFYLVKAMQALGSQYDAAASLVNGELSSFLCRFPSVTTLSFSNAMPFANAETLSWIQESVQISAGGGDNSVSELDMKVSEANSAGQSGRIQDGLRILSEYANQLHGERERFITQIKLGEYCLRFELLPPLFALVSRLREISKVRALDVWEPDLAVELSKLTWRCLSHKNVRQFISEGDVVAFKADVMATLAILDLPTAAYLTGKR